MVNCKIQREVFSKSEIAELHRMATTSLRTFLQNAARLMENANTQQHVTICVGNEASDVDSIVSSLTCAYLRETLGSRSSSSISRSVGSIGGKAKGEEQSHRFFVPVVAVPRSILKLRREAQVLLQMVGLELEDLICMEDIDLGKLSTAGSLQGFVLTDHNQLSSSTVARLPGGDDEAAAKVEMILDHHKDLGAYPLLSDGSVRRIAFDNETNKATAGSACTLISELMTELSPSGSDGDSNINRDGLQDVSVLLQGTICLDTQNMDPGGVGTERDAQALLHLAPYVDGKVDRETCFTAVRDAKYNPAFWEELSATDCLNIDYKQFKQADSSSSEVGIASTLLPLSSFVQKSDVLLALSSFIEKPGLEADSSSGVKVKALDALLVMSSVFLPSYRRELLVASFDEDLHNKLLAFLTVPAHDLDLTILQLSTSASSDGAVEDILVSGRSLYMQWYLQGNSRASRKQLAPLVQEFYKSN